MNVIGEFILQTVNFLADLLTVAASGIAIYVFFWKKDYLVSVFDAVINYSTQTTLSELTSKLEKLDSLDSRVSEEKEEIKNLLSAISGQLKGNPKIASYFEDVIVQINKATSPKGKFEEAWKQRITSELRERIRHIGVMNMQNGHGDKK